LAAALKKFGLYGGDRDIRRTWNGEKGLTKGEEREMKGQQEEPTAPGNYGNEPRLRSPPHQLFPSRFHEGQDQLGQPTV